MFKKIMTLTAVGALSLLSAAACTQSSPSEGRLTGIASQSRDVLDSSGVPYTPGTIAHTSDVVSFDVIGSDGRVATEEALGPILAAFPELADRVSALDGIDHVIMTEDSHLELYSGGDLVAVLALDGDNSAMVVWARDGFTAESISYSASATNQDQELASSLTFHFRSCVQPAEQEQEQEQEPEKDQEQSQEVEKGKVEPICENLTAILDMRQQVVKDEKEQEQKP